MRGRERGTGLGKVHKAGFELGTPEAQLRHMSANHKHLYCISLTEKWIVSVEDVHIAVL